MPFERTMSIMFRFQTNLSLRFAFVELQWFALFQTITILNHEAPTPNKWSISVHPVYGSDGFALCILFMDVLIVQCIRLADVIVCYTFLRNMAVL